MTHRLVASVGALPPDLSETACHGLCYLGPRARLDLAHRRLRGQCPRSVWNIVG